MLVSVLDPTVSSVSSQKLWLPTGNPPVTKPVKIPTGRREELLRPYSYRKSCTKLMASKGERVSLLGESGSW